MLRKDWYRVFRWGRSLKLEPWPLSLPICICIRITPFWTARATSTSWWSTSKSMGQTSAAMTDHGNIYGAVHFFNAAKEKGIKPILGCELYICKEDGPSGEAESGPEVQPPAGAGGERGGVPEPGAADERGGAAWVLSQAAGIEGVSGEACAGADRIFGLPGGRGLAAD